MVLGWESELLGEEEEDEGSELAAAALDVAVEAVLSTATVGVVSALEFLSWALLRADSSVFPLAAIVVVVVAAAAALVVVV